MVLLDVLVFLLGVAFLLFFIANLVHFIAGQTKFNLFWLSELWSQNGTKTKTKK